MATFQWIIFVASFSVVFSADSFQYALNASLNEVCGKVLPCGTPNSLCLDHHCQCRPGYTMDKTRTKCLKVAVTYYDSCEDENQCKEFLGKTAICKNNTCICDDAWSYYLHGQCYPESGLNEICFVNEHCFDGTEYQATKCVNRKCVCNDGFYLRGSNSCRRQMKNIGDECLLDHDCNFDNGTCVLHKCVNDGKPITEPSSSEIVTPIFKKDEVVKLGSDCKNNTDCQSIKNSICDVDGYCICDKAHFPSDDETSCIPEIGEACDPSIMSLHVEYAVCRENMWTCPIDRITTRDNRHCIELAEDYDESCETHQNCQILGPTGECNQGKCRCSPWGEYNNDGHYCGQKLGGNCRRNNDCDASDSICRNGTCTCRDNYFKDIHGKCVKGLGARCIYVDDCNAVEHSSCELGGCQCRPGFIAAKDSLELCLLKSHYAEKCEQDVQCLATLGDSFCNITPFFKEGHCDCRNGYFFKEGKCYRKKWITETCTNSDECFTPNSHCKNGSCKCWPVHTLVEDKCLLELGAHCEDNTDCTMKNSLCQNKKCSCAKHYYELDGQCATGIDAKCEKNEDCDYKNSVCNKTSKTCQCEVNFVGTPDNECMPILPYGEICKHNVQCSTTLPNAYCDIVSEENGVGVCVCREEYYFNKNQCYEKKYVKENCTEADQCFTKNSYCNNGHCECLSKFPKFFDGQCNSASAAIRPLFSIILVILLGLKALL